MPHPAAKGERQKWRRAVPRFASPLLWHIESAPDRKLKKEKCDQANMALAMANLEAPKSLKKVVGLIQ